MSPLQYLRHFMTTVDVGTAPNHPLDLTAPRPMLSNHAGPIPQRLLALLPSSGMDSIADSRG